MEGMFISYAPETAGALHWYTESYSPDTIDALLYPIAQSSTRIWSVNFLRDPDASTTLSVAWLKQHAAYANRFSSGATSILLFDTHSAVTLTGTLRSTVFDSRIRLDYPFTTHIAQPGDTVVVSLQWSALRKSDNYSSIYVHLISPGGQMVAQNDGDAVNGLAPAFTWEVGKPVIDRRAILVPATLPAGDYTLVVGMYGVPDGIRLQTTDGHDDVPIGTLQVTCTPHCP
jgi:hypothetical protein